MAAVLVVAFCRFFMRANTVSRKLAHLSILSAGVWRSTSLYFNFNERRSGGVLAFHTEKN